MAELDKIIGLITRLKSITDEAEWRKYTELSWKEGYYDSNIIMLTKNGKRTIEWQHTPNIKGELLIESFDNWLEKKFKRQFKDLFEYLNQNQVEGKLIEVWYKELQGTLEFAKKKFDDELSQDLIWGLEEQLTLYNDLQAGILGYYPRIKIRAMVNSLVDLDYLPKDKDIVDGYASTVLVNFLKLGVEPYKPFQSNFSGRAFNTFYAEINRLHKLRTGVELRKAGEFDTVMTITLNETHIKPSSRKGNEQLRKGEKRNNLQKAIRLITK